jgi:NADH-quinone oxidoreductase subunit D
LQETREAASIARKLIAGLPPGAIMAKVPRIIKIPNGETYVATENPLGVMGYYLISKGDTAILASLYFILGDVDR